MKVTPREEDEDLVLPSEQEFFNNGKLRAKGLQLPSTLTSFTPEFDLKSTVGGKFSFGSPISDGTESGSGSPSIFGTNSYTGYSRPSNGKYDKDKSKKRKVCTIAIPHYTHYTHYRHDTYYTHYTQTTAWFRFILRW